jgi:hypothetical protein
MQDAKSLWTTETPLAATLERLAAGGIDDEEMDLSARTGSPDGDGWVTVADLADNRELLEDLMSCVGREYGVRNPAYAGTAVLRGYLWRALSPAVAAFLAERRLPDLSAANVALRFGESGFAEDVAFVSPRFAALPDDPQAAHPDAEVVPSEGAMLGRMREALAGTHLPGVIPSLRELRVRRGTRVLQRAAADSCAEAFMFVGRELGREEEGLGFAEELLSGPPPLSAPTNYYVLEYPGGSERTRVRNTCCLYYKVGDGTCFTCPRTTDEERRLRIAEDG